MKQVAQTSYYRHMLTTHLLTVPWYLPPVLRMMRQSPTAHWNIIHKTAHSTVAPLRWDMPPGISVQYPRDYQSIKDAVTNTTLQHDPPVLSQSVLKGIPEGSNYLQKTNRNKEVREKMYPRQPDSPDHRVRKVRKHC